MAFSDISSRSMSQRETHSTVVGESIVITGNIEGDENLTILGRVEGAIRLSHTLEVADSGIVKADVMVHDAVISGIVVGNVTATGSVQVTDTGRLVGDIQAPRVIIVAGARVRGQVDMASALDDSQSEEAAEASLSQAQQLRLPARRQSITPFSRQNASSRANESPSARRDTSSQRPSQAPSPSRLSVAREEPRRDVADEQETEAQRHFGRPHLQERAHSVLTDLHPRYTKRGSPAAVPLRPTASTPLHSQSAQTSHGRTFAEQQASADESQQAHDEAEAAAAKGQEDKTHARQNQQQVHVHGKKRHGRRRDG